MRQGRFSVKQQARLERAFELFQSGELAGAAAEFRKLLRNHPADTVLLSNLGTIALHLGDLEEGMAILEKSLRIDPRQPAALTDYAHALSLRGKHQEALVRFENAISIQADYYLAHNNRGLALQNLGRLEEALESYARALDINPHYAEAYNNRGGVLQQLGRLGEALASYERAAALQPGLATAHNNMANVLQALGRLDEALASCDRAIALEPGFAEAHNNRGEILMGLNRPGNALRSYDRAVGFKPDFAAACSNRGNALKDLGRLDEALASYDRAIAIAPDHADGYWNKALLKLLTADYRDGWQLYEWRWKSIRKNSVRNFSQPLWLGRESIQGRTIFVHREQGYGDFMQFCRYVPLLEALGSNVMLESPAPLVSLLHNFGKGVSVVSEGQTPSDFDFHCPIMSLPLAFRTTVETVPATVPYLFVDRDKQERWRELLCNGTGKRIGLAWSGSATHQNDRNRSIPLRLLEPLLDLPFEFHCLQNEIRNEDAAHLARFPHLRVHQDRLTDFSETAALIGKLDLVISVDTAAAHLAGALGKEVWIMLPFAPDYRWMLDRSDSPWYPTARLFRQPAIGDWSSVLADITEHLQATIQFSLFREPS